MAQTDLAFFARPALAHLRSARVGLAVSCLAVATLAAGCSWKSWEYDDGIYKVTGYYDQKREFPPRSPDHEILILSYRPGRAHEIVAKIWAAWDPAAGSDDYMDLLVLGAFSELTGIELRPKSGAAGTARSGMTAQARALGGDAIVTERGTFDSPVCELYEKDEDGVANTDTCELLAVVGIVIRFEASRPGEAETGPPADPAASAPEAPRHRKSLGTRSAIAPNSRRRAPPDASRAVAGGDTSGPSCMELEIVVGRPKLAVEGNATELPR